MFLVRNLVVVALLLPMVASQGLGECCSGSGFMHGPHDQAIVALKMSFC